MKFELFGILLIIFLSNCKESYNNAKPASTGSPGHVLIVMDNSKWKSTPGDTLRSLFKQEYQMLPQAEPAFDYSHVPDDAFSGILRRSRNIFYADISVNNEKSQILTDFDLYAYPQLIVTVKANSQENFIMLISKNFNKIIDLFENAERDRLIKAYSGKLLNKTLKSELEKKHFYSLTIPTGYNLDVDKSNFVCLSRETPYSSQGILIWDYPFTDSTDFNLENLIVKRDEITKIYVIGPEEGTYMTSEKLIQPLYFIDSINQPAPVILRGLWKIEGSPGVFMGGPFVSYSWHDKSRNRIITVDAYAYGGQKKKRELMRQLEAIISTFIIL